MDYFTQITALAALAVVAFQTILKLNVVPLYLANKYPVMTNVVLSVAAAIVVSWQTALNFVSLWQWVAYSGLVSVLAAITYNSTLRNSVAVQKATNKVE